MKKKRTKFILATLVAYFLTMGGYFLSMRSNWVIQLSLVLLNQMILLEAQAFLRLPSSCQQFGRVATCLTSKGGTTTMCSASSMRLTQLFTLLPYPLLRRRSGYPPIWSVPTASNCLRTSCSIMAT